MSKIKKGHSVQAKLTEWLSYLENLHNTEIDLGLTRIQQVAQRLAIDLSDSIVVTVAGTNGKGTTCAFIENALLASNISCAVYSSPHIEHFNERLRINRQDIDDQSLIAAFEQIEQARASISLSYYEYTTLAAFLVMMAKRPQVILLEVGLGGRLDATNIIDSDIAVITTIDLDHQAFLGNTREAIGYEKAGIMRRDKPVVIGDISPPTSVLDYAQSIQAVLYLREQDFFIEEANTTMPLSPDIDDAALATEIKWYCHCDNIYYPIRSDYAIPRDNIATAIQVLQLLFKRLSLALDASLINHVVEQTKVAGRLEKFITPNHDVILDVGHNPQAARYLASQLSRMDYDNIYAVFAMLKDKDIQQTVAPMLAYIDHWFVGGLAQARACDAKTLAKQIPVAQTNINCFDNVSQAFKMARQKANKNDLVLVFGSFFTVASVRNTLL